MYHIEDLAMYREGSNFRGGTTWVHPLLAVRIAQWVSPTFALQVDIWVRKLLRDRIVEYKEEEIRKLKEDFAKRYKALETKSICDVDDDGETERGYIYCISNPTMVGIYKIRFTTRDLTERLAEANKRGTWSPPADYEIEFAKHVGNARKEETNIHILLEEKRMKGEFFREDLNIIKSLFERVDDEWWKP